MLLNVSYNDKEKREKIAEEVGKPFSLKKRITMGGIGSPKMVIEDSSLEIRNLLILDNNRNVCQIELRPKGIILSFRSLLETYALIIPYYKLVVYKTDKSIFTIHRDQYFVKVDASKDKGDKFIMRMLNFKSDISPTSIEDL